MSQSSGPTSASHSELDYKDLLIEFQNTKRKLENKVEALLLVSQEFGSVQDERDLLRAKLAQAEAKCASLKKALKANHQIRANAESSGEEQRNNLMQVLNSLNDENKTLKSELDATKTKLGEAMGDVKLLRQQLAQYHLLNSSGISSNDVLDKVIADATVDITGSAEATITDKLRCNGEATDANDAESHDNLLHQLETVKKQYGQLEGDLRSVLCEKEELVIERDSYRNKAERLNKEISFILSGDEKRVMTDMDGVIMENRFLKEQLNHAQEEAGLAKATTSKYKNMLEKRKKPSKGNAGAPPSTTLITQKQVREVLQQTGLCPDGKEFELGDGSVDYKALATALFDALNDRILALSHQRKANKILGTRLSELESRMKHLELSGSGHISPINRRISVESPITSSSPRPASFNFEAFPCLQPLSIPLLTYDNNPANPGNDSAPQDLSERLAEEEATTSADVTSQDAAEAKSSTEPEIDASHQIDKYDDIALDF